MSTYQQIKKAWELNETSEYVEITRDIVTSLSLSKEMVKPPVKPKVAPRPPKRPLKSQHNVSHKQTSQKKASEETPKFQPIPKSNPKNESKNKAPNPEHRSLNPALTPAPISSHQSTPTQSIERDIPLYENWKKTGQVTKLADIAKLDAESFPMKISLRDGYFGQTSRFSLSAGDCFDVHYSKSTRVLTIYDSIGVKYTIPFNSDFKLGIFHNSTSSDLLEGSKRRKASKKYQEPQHQCNDASPASKSLPEEFFPTIHDLLAVTPLPKVVCATRASDKASPVSSVKQGEILIIQEIYDPPTKPHKGLKCYSVQNKCKKLLPENCRGNFSLTPSHTKLHVLELLEQVENILPCQAMMFLGSESMSSIPTSVPKKLLTKPITMFDVVMEESLVVTSAVDCSAEDQPIVSTSKPAEEQLGSQRLFEIPLDGHLGELQADILESPNEVETEKLYVSTREIMTKYDPHQHYMALLDRGSDKQNDAQALLYMSTRKDIKNAGVEIRASEKMYYENVEFQNVSNSAKPEKVVQMKSTIPKKQKETKTFSTRPKLPEYPTPVSDFNPSEDHLYEAIDHDPDLMYDDINVEDKRSLSTSSHNRSKTFNSLESGKYTKPLFHAQPKLQSPPHMTTSQELQQPPLPFSPEPSDYSYVHMVPSQSLSPELQHLSPSSTPQSSESGRFSNESLSPQMQFQSPDTLPHFSPEKIAANKLFLRKMSLPNMMDMLTAMNLSQYNEAFAQNSVSGEILFECTESVLEHELGITSKIHRIRMMKVINGIHSAQNILNGESPYDL